jgi:trimethylamine--corrinoid protein Co-methyltransferase
MPLFNLVPEEAVEAIENTSLNVLEEIGMKFLHPPAVETLKKYGAIPDKEDPQILRFDRNMILEKVALAPSQFTVTARNPQHSIVIGGRNIVFASVGSAPNASDLDNGRRPGNFQDYQNFIKLIQTFNSIHASSGYPVEPQDIHPKVRHLECLKAQALLSDKSTKCYVLGKPRTLDAFEITKRVHGISHEQFCSSPHIWTVVNTNSPLILDGPMAEGVMTMAEHGQATIITPFTLSGAMAPATIPGALVMQNAEFLATAALSQCTKPGAPIIYGSFTSNVDMRSGSPAFGTPENVKASQISGQLARRYNLPIRLSNATASNIPDAQAAQETVMSMWACLTANANVVNHSAGWLEGGLCASFEKFVIDAAMLDAVDAYLEPTLFNEDQLAMDAIREVKSGGHFFGAQHTMERYAHAFHEPFASDWSNFGAWTENGSQDSLTRANRIYHDIINNFEPPPLPEDRKEDLEEFVQRRTKEGGVPTDF